METKIFTINDESFNFYKKIIKEQGVEICRNEFEKNFISTTINKASFGIVIYQNKANIGKSKFKKDNIYIHGFILCRIDKSTPKFAWIDLICAREKSKVGSTLLQLAEEVIIENKETILIQLYSTHDIKLKNWYQKQGYQVSEVVMFNEIKPKAYLMQKFLI